MRINLVTSFAEKDQAKALGARWDAVRKQWYIVDVADLAPFMRWIPDLVAASQNVLDAPSARAVPPMKAVDEKSRAGTITKPLISIVPCTCAALPWEHCVHSAG